MIYKLSTKLEHYICLNYVIGISVLTKDFEVINIIFYLEKTRPITISITTKELINILGFEKDEKFLSEYKKEYQPSHTIRKNCEEFEMEFQKRLFSQIIDPLLNEWKKYSLKD